MSALKAAEKKAILGAVLRVQGEPLATIELKDIVEELDLDTFELREGRDGGEYLRLIGKKGWVNISIGKSVELTRKGEKRIDELTSNYVIYCGWNDREGNRRERPWLTYGTEGGSEKGVVATMKLADVMALQP